MTQSFYLAANTNFRLGFELEYNDWFPQMVGENSLKPPRGKRDTHGKFTVGLRTCIYSLYNSSLVAQTFYLAANTNF